MCFFFQGTLFKEFLFKKTEVKQGKFVEFISREKGYFRETYKSQNINHISPTPYFTLGIIQTEGGQNISYHVAAFLILFHLICKMTVF